MLCFDVRLGPSSPQPSTSWIPTLHTLTRRFIEHETEQFQDDPLESNPLDLVLPGAGATADIITRRQAAAAVLQSLVSSGFEADATEIVAKWIGEGLAAYQKMKGRAGRVEGLC